jgi:hypothetical protein
MEHGDMTEIGNYFSENIPGIIFFKANAELIYRVAKNRELRLHVLYTPTGIAIFLMTR